MMYAQAQYSEQHSINPHDNMDYLLARFQELPAQTQEEFFLALATKWHQQGRTIRDLQQTIERLNKQYERALLRINILQQELLERQGQPEEES